MAHGLNSVIKRSVTSVGCAKTEGKTGIGSRRIFAPHFKLQVLDSYRNDADCKGNQRATARKYGIHRRQIQKWLQVENTLRNSVVPKGKLECTKTTDSHDSGNKVVALSSSRPRDDDVVESRVPCESTPWPAPPAPLDFTTHSRDYTSPSVARLGSPPAPLDPPATPIDLSFKKSSAPATFSPSLPLLLSSSSPPSLVQTPAHPDPDVWDLSTKNLKRKYDEAHSPQSQSPVSNHTSPKPVKLFKPYLDVIQDDDDDDEDESTLKPTGTSPPCCSSIIITNLTPCSDPTHYYNYNNNNNNNIEIKHEYPEVDIKTEYHPSYSITELHPKSYYYPYTNYHSEYEVVQPFYEDNYINNSYTPTHLKQRHSYSLDFKLSAIDCYYQDSVCKGNQRAVATKYNVHRRQVQKWLKQADELRLRNESVKQMHAVR